MNNNRKWAAVVAVVVVVIAVVGIVFFANHKKAGDSSTAKTSSTNSTSGTDTSDNSSSSSDSSASTPSDTTPTATNTVAIQDFAFSPANITVKVGDTVTWTNKDSTAHTVTADTASADAPASGNVAQNGTYTFTFKKAGTYIYHCAIHPNMQGSVTVTN
jgi:plastocyanin